MPLNIKDPNSARVCMMYQRNQGFYLAIHGGSEKTYQFFGPTKKVDELIPPLKPYGQQAIILLQHLYNHVRQVDKTMDWRFRPAASKKGSRTSHIAHSSSGGGKPYSPYI